MQIKNNYGKIRSMSDLMAHFTINHKMIKIPLQRPLCSSRAHQFQVTTWQITTKSVKLLLLLLFFNKRKLVKVKYNYLKHKAQEDHKEGKNNAKKKTENQK